MLATIELAGLCSLHDVIMYRNSGANGTQVWHIRYTSPLLRPPLHYDIEMRLYDDDSLLLIDSIWHTVVVFRVIHLLCYMYLTIVSKFSSDNDFNDFICYCISIGWSLCIDRSQDWRSWLNNRLPAAAARWRTNHSRLWTKHGPISFAPKCGSCNEI